MTSPTTLFFLISVVNLTTAVLGQNEQICLSLQRDHPHPMQGESYQGAPGKRGGPGPTGPQGIKGDPGPPGQCQCNVSEVVELRERLDKLERELTNRRNNETGSSAESTSSEVSPRSEVLRAEVCLVGVKSGAVRDRDMTASSAYSDRHYYAHEGRLDRTNPSKSWIPATHRFQSPGEWLQVDLRTPTTLTGVVTQGRHRQAQWVTRFKISFGNSTSQLQVIQNTNGNDMIFRGNTDSSTHVVNMFPHPITTRYFRLIVVSYHGLIALRLDYLTC